MKIVERMRQDHACLSSIGPHHSPHWRCAAVGECAGLLFFPSISLSFLLSWWPPRPLGVGWFKHGPQSHRWCCVSSLHSCAHLLLGSLMYTHSQSFHRTSQMTPFFFLSSEAASLALYRALLRVLRTCRHSSLTMVGMDFDPISDSRNVHKRSRTLGCV